MRAASLFGLGFLLAACGGSSSSITSSDGGTSADAGTVTPSGGDAGACATSVTPSAGTVVTDRGPVQGKMENGTWAYEGIPYAAPPLGSLRWTDTQAHACWSTTLAATSFGSECLQLSSCSPATVAGQEDCLFANVWTPSGATASSKLPVLVFIHGGGNVQGSSSDTGKGTTPIYDGAALAAKENVVVVTFNYRLGPLGFLAHTAFGASSGNYGLRDQLFLLGWVQRNAAAFGGDRAHVLLFGQSAGGEDVCNLVASPLSKGLFTAALSESGGCSAHAAATAQSFAQTWAQKAGCGSASDVASCLRALSANAVETVQPECASVSAAKQSDYEPTIDGAVLPSAPDQILRAGSQAHVPIVFGSNSDETYSRGSFASQRLADNDDAAIDRLIDARGLRVTDARVGALGIGKVEALFRYLAASPGIYYFHMRRPDGVGHAMGLKFSEGGYFLFDPNTGLFKSTDLVTFGYRNDNYVYSNYMHWSEGKFIFRKCEI